MNFRRVNSEEINIRRISIIIVCNDLVSYMYIEIDRL